MVKAVQIYIELTFNKNIFLLIVFRSVGGKNMKNKIYIDDIFIL